jgi:glycosyltransferase involved in cell wall biosynthesis
LVVDVVIPALNERVSLPRVLDDLPRALIREIVVVDNGSTDGTGDIAASRGCAVVREPRRGYGSACLAGLAYLEARPAPPDVVAFLDADRSDRADELGLLLAPIDEGRADLVVGSRELGARERGALLPQQRAGNWVASTMIRVLYGVSITDLGPFRAIRWSALRELRMADTTYGWTAEMQVKAFRAGLRFVEVPVSYRRRQGRSKIAGTVRGTIGASFKIVTTIVRHAWG